MDKVHSLNLDAPLISVVAPVYNVEPFLQECIDSVLNQSFKDFELILVDDGSPDKCGEICDKAAKADRRIKVVHQENGGEFAARKGGTNIARGEWICFIDADDLLFPNALQDLISAPENSGYNIDDFDVIEGGHIRVQRDSKKEKYLPTAGDAICQKDCGIIIADGLEYAKSIIYADNKTFFQGVMWRKIIRKSLLIKADALDIPRKFFQGCDCFSNLRIAKKLRKALKIQNTIYKYMTNPKSVCSVNKERFCQFDYSVALWEYAKETLIDMDKEWQEVYKIFVAKTFYEFFSRSKMKWQIRSLEFKPYLKIIQEKKEILPSKAKICLLLTRFPFTLLPERFFFFFLYVTKTALSKVRVNLKCKLIFSCKK